MQPPLVAPGTPVYLVAPAFAVSAEVAGQAMAFWQGLGMQPRLMPHALGRHHAFAGTDEERLADLRQALAAPGPGIVHALRGGYGLSRLLDALPLAELLAAAPKHLYGFSDITAGLLAWEAVGQGAYACHAPMASHLADAAAPDAAALAGLVTTGKLAFGWEDPSAQALDGLAVVGPATGGNLTLLAHTLGSAYPVRAAGKILLIEEVGEQRYHLDRMMLQLCRAGALDGALAVLLGHVTDVRDTTPPFGQSVYEIVRTHVPAGIPVVAGVPVGHARPNYPIPFGRPLRLEARHGQWTLEALEPNPLATA